MAVGSGVAARASWRDDGGACAEKARDARRQPDGAEEARDGEKTARAAAERARDGEATAREALARVEYGRTIEVALQEWRENNVPAAIDLLDGTRPTSGGGNGVTYIVFAIPTWSRSRGTAGPFPRRSARTGRGSSPPVMTRRRRCGTPGPAPSSLRSRDTPLTSVGKVQPGRVANRHRAVLTKTATVWDAQDRRRALTLKGHTGIVRWAEFSPDGSRVVTAVAITRRRCGTPGPGAEVLTLEGHSDPFFPTSSADPRDRVRVFV